MRTHASLGCDDVAPVYAGDFLSICGRRIRRIATPVNPHATSTRYNRHRLAQLLATGLFNGPVSFARPVACDHPVEAGSSPDGFHTHDAQQWVRAHARELRVCAGKDWEDSQGGLGVGARWRLLCVHADG